MKTRLLAAACVVATSCLPAWAQPPGEGELTLHQALALTLDGSPELQAFPTRIQSLRERRDSAALRPALQLNAGLENALGTGELSDLEAAEITLSLSSVVEMGDKRQARMDVAANRVDQVVSQQQVRELDLLAEAASRFIERAEAEALQSLQRQALELAEEAESLVTPLVEAGQSPDLELTRARAAVIRARQAVARAASETERAGIALSAMWGSTSPAFETVQAALPEVGEPGDLNALLMLLPDNPDLLLLGSEQRMLEARLRESRSQARADLTWSAGLRQSRELNDAGFVFSVSVPLGSRDRASPEISAARLDLATLDAEREASLKRLQSRLIVTWEALVQAIDDVTILQEEVLPLLGSVVSDTRSAYEAGIYSYQELVDARREYLDAEQDLITRAAHAHRLRIELERLAGVPLTEQTRNTP